MMQPIVAHNKGQDHSHVYPADDKIGLQLKNSSNNRIFCEPTASKLNIIQAVCAGQSLPAYSAGYSCTGKLLVVKQKFADLKSNLTDLFRSRSIFLHLLVLQTISILMSTLYIYNKM